MLSKTEAGTISVGTTVYYDNVLHEVTRINPNFNAPSFELRSMIVLSPEPFWVSWREIGLELDRRPAATQEGSVERMHAMHQRMQMLNNRRAAIEQGLGVISHSLPLASDGHHYQEALVVPMAVLERLLGQHAEIREALVQGMGEGVYDERAK